MMVQTRRRQTREVTGPTPHSVAIFARPPNKRPPEHLILDRRKQEDQRMRNEELTKYNKLCDLKNDWERWTDRKIQLNTVKRKVQGLLQAEQFSVEDRRERLRDLLSREDEQYLMEMEAKEETTLERQAKMRERAKQLREKRETERLAYVQEKLDQQWRDQCEELRSTMSKRQQDEVAAERMEQLRIKDQMKKMSEQQEKMYADLWYADMMAKAAREEADTKRQMEAHKDVLNTLQKQMAALEAQKEEEKRLVLEEAQLMREQAELRKLEELHALEEKRRKQKETQEQYDRSLKMKMKKAAREEQEQLAYDMKMLEQLVEESRNEAMEQQQRKKELKEEYQRYRQYLQQLAQEKSQRERELERLCDIEVEKMWQKKLAQWRLEKQARQKLLADVLATRQRQVSERLMENDRKLQEAQREREELLRKIEENKRIEREQHEKMWQQNKGHQKDLLDQMDYNQRQKSADLSEDERMWRAQQAAEQEYQRKLLENLENPHVDKMHPMRRRALKAQAAE